MSGQGRIIGVVTSARADFGLLRRLMAAIQAEPGLELVVYATGMHHSPRHGMTIAEVRDAGFSHCLIEVESWVDGDGPDQIATSMGRGLAGFAAAFAARRPHILVVLGDRYDMMPAALAALPFTIPVAHISGGEVTEGAIDESIRHAVTKLSHLHFPSTEDYGRRIRQLGEEAWRVTMSGQPGLDELADFTPDPRDAVLARFGLDPSRPVSLVTYHPETVRAEDSPKHVAQLLSAAQRVDSQILFTAPNSDPGSEAIRTAIEAYVATHPGCVFRESLGRTNYSHMLHHAQCMVGNSSSGLIEAASIPIPVVNIGDRQGGRLAPRNVILAKLGADSIATAWKRALDPAFRRSLSGMVNPYGDGKAIARIVERLKSVALDQRLITKHFQDWRENPA
jgi:UDP-hydrolysing UDP-N-acetyl-D-glucosamine 2-epimerase